MQYGESAFDTLYLLFVLVAGIIILIKKRDAVGRFMGFASIVLALGDACHLVPRVLSYWLPYDLTFYVGYGKLATSVTMTIFYLLLYFLYKSLYKIEKKSIPGTDFVVIMLTVLRIGICALPDNNWLGVPQSPILSVLWASFRNIPFLLLGIVIVVLYCGKRKEDEHLKPLWILVIFSFLFYLPVAIMTPFYPILGMLMIPKTICYILMVVLFLKKASSGPESGVEGTDGIGEGGLYNASPIKEFSYSFNNSIGGSNYTYTLKNENGAAIFVIDSMEHRDYKDLAKPVDQEFVKKIHDLYRDFDVRKWDGFSKSDRFVLDGSGFNLRIVFDDARTVSASGTNCFPPGYSEFEKKLEEIVTPVKNEIFERERLKIIEKGLTGKITSILANFIQSGTSGSDSYKIMINSKVEKENVDVTIKSASGEFFPQGDHRFYCHIDDNKLGFEVVEEMIKKHELIKWYDYDKAAADYNNREWFQVSIQYEDGAINAVGTEYPEHYAEFRKDFIEYVKALVNGTLVIPEKPVIAETPATPEAPASIKASATGETTASVEASTTPETSASTESNAASAETEKTENAAATVIKTAATATAADITSATETTAENAANSTVAATPAATPATEAPAEATDTPVATSATEASTTTPDATNTATTGIWDEVDSDKKVDNP